MGKEQGIFMREIAQMVNVLRWGLHGEVMNDLEEFGIRGDRRMRYREMEMDD